MKAAELTVEVNRLVSENTALRADVDRLMAKVTALVEHDKVIRAEVRELRAKRQPDTLERRAAGMTEYQAARKAIIAEQGLPSNAWVPNTQIRARMEALRAQPLGPADEEVVL